MPKIGCVSFVEKSIQKNQFKIKKKFGQNFLTDSHILEAIVEASGVTENDAVIEIGPGLGGLTELICQKAGFVLAYEIDHDLIPILSENLSAFSNYKILEEDILKAEIKKDIDLYLKKYDNIYVIANLPYYITTPILTGLLSQRLPIKSYIMMMQLEVANRICGKPDTKDYNALSVWIEYRARAQKLMKVPRTVFIPMPNVDSAVVKLEAYDSLPIEALDEQIFFEVIRISFAQRRKTLLNNLSLAYPKEFVCEMLKDLNISPSIRAEALVLKDFIQISDFITQNLNK